MAHSIERNKKWKLENELPMSTRRIAGNERESFWQLVARLRWCAMTKIKNTPNGHLRNCGAQWKDWCYYQRMEMRRIQLKGMEMFYIICDGQVVDASDKRPTWKELKQWANDLNAEAYVIRGEHAGMSAEPDNVDEATVEEDVNSDLADTVKRTVSFAEDWFRNAGGGGVNMKRNPSVKVLKTMLKQLRSGQPIEPESVAEYALESSITHIEQLEAIIAYIDKRCGPADKTCDEPGISVSEAARRELRDDGHRLFQEES